MIHRIALALSALLIVAIAPAQQKMNFALRGYVDAHRGSGEMLDVMVRGDRDCVASAVRELGGTMKMGMQDISSVHIPLDAVEELSRRACVRGFEFSLEPGVALNDSARYRSRIHLAQQGMAPLPMPYTGKGVIVGIIDTGSDFRHDDFRLPDGRTRVLKYWDHYCSTDPLLIPADYGYGQVFDSAMINAGTFPVCPPNLDHQFGHGTTVMGAAASDGSASGQYTGGATEADLIVVGSKLTLPNWRSTIVDAVRWILDEAAALGRPCVINCSLGSYFGSHDALDAHALLIDSLLNAGPGRILVQAAGNIGNLQAHARQIIGADTTYTWFYDANGTALGANTQLWDCWADSADIANVQYAVGADKVQPVLSFRGRTAFRPVYLDSLIVDTLWSESGNFLAQVVFEAHPRGAQVNLQVRMYGVDSSAYRWRFMTTGSGLLDIWASEPLGASKIIPADSLPVPDPLYMAPDLAMNTVDSWPCSPSVLTVGNYFNEGSYICANGTLVDFAFPEDDLVENSSHGPTRDGRLKPDLAAPGDVSLSAAPPALLTSFLASPTNVLKVSSDSLHIRNGGTSMAAPVVTGAVALFLQKCGYAYPDDVIDVFTSTAATDAFTGTVPSNSWGNGKLDAFAALVSTNFTFDPTLTPLGPAVFCPGDSSGVLADPTFDQYVWSNGSESVPPYKGMAFSDGPLYVTMATAQGCTANSDTAWFSLHPAPAVPVITDNGGLLESTPADQYQWYLDGSPIIGGTQQTQWATVSGTYMVVTTDANGCSAASDTLQVVSTTIADDAPNGSIALWPSPASDVLNVNGWDASAPAELVVLDAQGKVVMHRTSVTGALMTIDVSTLSAGSYTLRITQAGRVGTRIFPVR